MAMTINSNLTPATAGLRFDHWFIQIKLGWRLG